MKQLLLFAICVVCSSSIGIAGGGYGLEEYNFVANYSEVNNCSSVFEKGSDTWFACMVAHLEDSINQTTQNIQQANQNFKDTTRNFENGFFLILGTVIGGITVLTTQALLKK